MNLMEKEIKELIIGLNDVGMPFFTGGGVRDYVIGVPPSDIDIEVFYTTEAELVKAINKITDKWPAKVERKIFRVYRLFTGTECVDISMPRVDVYVGKKHNDIEIRDVKYVNDIKMDIKAAAVRRDLTINALYMDINGRLYDPFGGIDDIKKGVMKHVDSSTFVKDPLRPLRIFKFASRYGFSVHPKTIKLCQNMVDGYKHLPVERITSEWLDWASGKYIEAGINFLIESNWFDIYSKYINSTDLAELYKLRHIEKRTPKLIFALLLYNGDLNFLKFIGFSDRVISDIAFVINIVKEYIENGSESDYINEYSYKLCIKQNLLATIIDLYMLKKCTNKTKLTNLIKGPVLNGKDIIKLLNIEQGENVGILLNKMAVLQLKGYEREDIIEILKEK